MINSYKIRKEENLKNKANREKEYIKDLKNNLDSYSIKNGRFLISFLIFLFVVFTIAVNTTDKNLLFNSLISFPIIRWELPTKIFYIIAPLILLIFHFNILFNLSEHFKVLVKWLNIKDLNEEKKYHLLRPFIFNYLLTYKTQKYKYLIFMIIFVSIFVFIPLIVLYTLQLNFLPYHSFYITNYHKIVFFIDLIFIVYFLNEVDKSIAKIINTKYSKSMKIILVISYPLILLLLIYVSFYVLDIPKTNKEKEIITGKRISQIIHRNLYLPNETLVKSIPSDILIASLLQQGKTLEEIMIEHSKGLDLRGRNLDFANFENSKMYNINFKNTKLNNVNFRGVKLQNANFEASDLNYTNFARSDLTNANFESIHIYNVSFSYANIDNTNFSFLFEKIYISNNQLCQNKFIANHFIVNDNNISYYKNYINKNCSQEFKNELTKEFGFKFENNSSKKEI